MAIARNQAHRLLGGSLRGGHRTQEWADPKRAGHEQTIVDSLWPHLPDLDGCVAVELGPGDALNVSRKLLAEGCRRVWAVEPFATAALQAEDDGNRLRVAPVSVAEFDPGEPINLIISHDVLEHVDVPAAMRAAFDLLAPGGRFVSSVDLRGHNAFNKPQRPLDFLTCPDWLYRAMHSHIETSNRVRPSELLDAAEAAGFVVEATQPLDEVSDAYLDAVRPHLQPRYRTLSDDDLRPTQLVVALRRPLELGASPAHAPSRPHAAAASVASAS